MRFLLIDDNPADRELARRLLASTYPEASFVEVRSREELEAALKGFTFDLVVTDYQLRWSDGLQLLEMLQQRLPGTPVIMVTETASEEIAVAAMRAGLADYILKRHLRRLPAAVQRALDEARLRRERDEANERYRALTEMISDYAYAFRVTPEGTLQGEWVTDSFVRVFGLTLSEIDARGGWTSMVFPDDLPRALEHARKVASGQADVCEMRFVTRDGQVRWLRDYARPVWDEKEGRVVRIYGASQDITEQKNAEEALRKSETRYRLLADNASDVIFTVDLDLRFTYVSPAVERLRGFTVEETLQQHPSEVLTPASYERTMRVLAEILEAEALKPAAPNLTRVLELEVTRKDGSTLWAETTLSGLRDENGQLIGFQGICRDISGRKRAEQALATQVARVELLNRIARAMAERLDLESIVQIVLKKLEEEFPADAAWLIMWDEEEVPRLAGTGTKAEGLAHAAGMERDELLAMAWHYADALRTGQTVVFSDLQAQRHADLPPSLRAAVRSLACAPLRVDANLLGVLVVARQQPQAFSSEEGTFLNALAEHVSLAAHHAQLYRRLELAYEELRRTQAAVMQQERLRALGKMASGIAHDINNAIFPATLYAEMLLKDPSLRPEARKHLEVILASCQDVVHTVARLREFYRPRGEEEVLVPTDLNQTVQHVAELTRPYWQNVAQEHGITVTVHFDLAPDLPPVPVAEPQLREALTNLVINAVDAMPGGGTLTLRTRQESQGDGLWVVIEVADTGTGMDEATRRHCLEPFFTTKTTGTGLGLPMVFGFVQRHDGQIEIDSAPGQGTTVRLLLPVQSKASTPTEEESIGVLRPLRILFVDDEPLIRAAMADLLEEQGHIVQVAEDGREGVASFRAALERGQPFDVVITDLGMPNLDGRQVAKQVKQFSPRTPVVLLSGWGLFLDNTELPAEVDAVLSKPPRLHELQRMLARLIHAADQGPLDEAAPRKN